MKKQQTVEGRAVEIAAVIIQMDGLCRYDTVEKCHRIYVDERVCRRCIKMWLLNRAKRELKESKS
jgi:hypothetical protein